jgi:hypothetical protein
MIRQICGTLHQWEKNPAVKAVLFTGAGERAFCAGGDVKAFHRAGMAYRRGTISQPVSAMFFAEEYSLNRQIFHYKKPTIAFMDGIVMGGGYGIGGNCAHRIARKNHVRDAGDGNRIFSGCGGGVSFAACAAESREISGFDGGAGECGGHVLQAKLAEYFVPSNKKEELIAALAGGGDVKRFCAGFQRRQAWGRHFCQERRAHRAEFQLPDAEENS